MNEINALNEKMKNINQKLENLKKHVEQQEEQIRNLSKQRIENCNKQNELSGTIEHVQKALDIESNKLEDFRNTSRSLELDIECYRISSNQIPTLLIKASDDYISYCLKYRKKIKSLCDLLLDNNFWIHQINQSFMEKTSLKAAFLFAKNEQADCQQNEERRLKEQLELEEIKLAFTKDCLTNNNSEYHTHPFKKATSSNESYQNHYNHPMNNNNNINNNNNNNNSYNNSSGINHNSDIQTSNNNVENNYSNMMHDSLFNTEHQNNNTLDYLQGKMSNEHNIDYDNNISENCLPFYRENCHRTSSPYNRYRTVELTTITTVTTEQNQNNKAMQLTEQKEVHTIYDLQPTNTTSVVNNYLTATNTTSVFTPSHQYTTNHSSNKVVSASSSLPTSVTSSHNIHQSQSVSQPVKSFGPFIQQNIQMHTERPWFQEYKKRRTSSSSNIVENPFETWATATTSHNSEQYHHNAYPDSYEDMILQKQQHNESNFNHFKNINYQNSDNKMNNTHCNWENNSNIQTNDPQHAVFPVVSTILENNNITNTTKQIKLPYHVLQQRFHSGLELLRKEQEQHGGSKQQYHSKNHLISLNNNDNNYIIEDIYDA